jgi:membrane protease YdiL (CAAX protease family)
MSTRLSSLKSIGLLFLYLILGLLCIILAMSLVFQLNPFKFFTEIRNNLSINITYIALLYIMIFVTVQYRAKKEGFEGINSFGLSRRCLDKATLIKIGSVTAIFMLGYFCLFVLSGTAHFKPLSIETLSLGLQGIVFGFLYALVEEVFFRGIVLQLLLRGFSVPGSFIIAGSFFASLHLFRQGDALFKGMFFIGLFMLAILLSWTWYRTRSLWTPIVIHMVLITGMYLKNSILSVNEQIYSNQTIIWGAGSTPLAGLAGMLMLILLTGIIKYILPDTNEGK